jgi:2,4-dienoyl-CoA reductase-like NADH-dependent reductase (Old Yellow Enzyme family)
MRFLREVVAGIRSKVPGLEIAVRLSAFDWQPFQKGKNGLGEPVLSEDEEYGYAFGGDRTGTGIRLDEAVRFLQLLVDLDIELVCITAGSPYCNPHIQRPALFPPSDGYFPPEDPLAGVARQIRVTAILKEKFPALAFVGSAYSYLQEFLANVAQNVIRTGKADFIGLGRMMLSYPEFPDDVLKGRSLKRKRICRTFSDCTTAPRGGLHSGCYPLDDHYRTSPEAQILRDLKRRKK